jgi:hypothetical protein
VAEAVAAEEAVGPEEVAEAPVVAVVVRAEGVAAWAAAVADST